MENVGNRTPNALAQCTSPYLIQHAYNPVNWLPWNEATAAKAVEAQKPVIVSIGYAACHWCHVMEQESFEDERVAAFMNAHFTCIKVDREEHPPIDHFYMNACQILTGSGGWPLNMFLTPELKPFSGGTYFPPEPRYGKPSWMDALTFIYDVWANKREEAYKQAEQLTAQIGKNEERLLSLRVPDAETEWKIPHADIVANILRQADPVNGGFGGAPKFPSAMVLTYLMRVSRFIPNAEADKQVQLSLDHMMKGGIFDHVAGGFSRYTVDAAWMVPHFEKMLYDNALLLSLYAEAYRCYQNEAYLEVVQRLVHFALQEWLTPEGCFYASYDADSEGVEGKFYTWEYNEIVNILSEDADWFCAHFDIKPEGNWEHRNILHLNHDKVLPSVDKLKLAACLERLDQHRRNRVKPALDDKRIVSWNALFAEGLVQAWKATGNPTYLLTAEKAVDGLLTLVYTEGSLFHSSCRQIAEIPANLEDYAALIQVCLSLFGETGNQKWLQLSIDFCQQVENTCFDEVSGMFTFGSSKDTSLPQSTIELFDHAVPSGNALMADQYRRLYTYTGNQSFEQRSRLLCIRLQKAVSQFPLSFGAWLQAMLPFSFTEIETVVAGPEAKNWLKELNRFYYPLQITLCVCDNTLHKWPLSADRYDENVTRIFICKDQVCAAPVNSVSEYADQLSSF